MPRVTISIPKDLHDRLLKYSGDSEESLSYTITKMADIGLMISESQQEIKSPEDRFSKIENHCFKLIIQMNALLKNMASELIKYGPDEFNKLLGLTSSKYQELMGIKAEDL